jgi:hypothetical protein
MPEVNGMRFPYTPSGKAAAKKAALNQKKTAKKAAVSSMRSKKKSNFSGLRSQIYGG